MIEIEKGIPTPPRSRYPLRDMEIGDSIFIPSKTSLGFSGYVASAGKQTGFKFSTRKAIKDGVTGLRVWRIS
jgi:hypothetical protein